MSSYLLEQTRGTMETLEQGEKAIILSLFNKQENVKKLIFLKILYFFSLKNL